jgi:hypothetical protein
MNYVSLLQKRGEAFVKEKLQHRLQLKRVFFIRISQSNLDG